MQKILLLILSYALGAIPFGLIVGRIWRGVDIRELGSGNIGATNVYRSLGLGPGIVVFGADVLKGLIPVLCANRIASENACFVVAVGMLAILGHTLSPFLGFKGGKGVATSLGVGIGLVPVPAAMALGIWIVILAVTRYVSVASMLACSCVPFMIWWMQEPVSYKVFGISVAIYVIFKHRSNIGRLIHGNENRFGGKRLLGG